MSNASSQNISAIRRPISAVVERWWVHLLRGIIAIAFGLVAFVWPQMTMLTLLFFYGVFALLDGFIVIGGIAGRAGSSAIGSLLAGTIGIGIGLLTLFWPGVVAVGLVVYVGIWAMIRGAMDVFHGLQLRKRIPNEWSLPVSGLLSILFGFLIFVAPQLGIVAIIWPVAACAVLAGILLIALAFRLRGLESDRT